MDSNSVLLGVVSIAGVVIIFLLVKMFILIYKQSQVNNKKIKHRVKQFNKAVDNIADNDKKI